MSDSPITLEMLGVAALPELTVRAAQQESFACAVDKGWHEDDDAPPSSAVRDIAAEGLKIMQLCQRVEAIRKGVEPAPYVMFSVLPDEALAGLSDLQVRALSWMTLICTEAVEAMEDIVNGKFATTIREDGKPEGLGSEGADIVIRVFDHFSALGIDVAMELRNKFAFNRTRSHRHGGRLA